MTMKASILAIAVAVALTGCNEADRSQADKDRRLVS